MKITGRVVSGSRLGRTLGYPTANLAVGPDVEAPDGVYAAWVWLGEKRYGAMANLGVKPTFSEGGDRFLELHLLDFDGDLYGQTLTVELHGFIRPEKKFPTPAALRTQIAKDEKQIRNTLNKEK
jgi:riboflavin kinase/FMN adenylyltransferase